MYLEERLKELERWTRKEEASVHLRLKNLEAHVDKLDDLLNLEDRITASDVLNRLFLVEEAIKGKK